MLWRMKCTNRTSLIFSSWALHTKLRLQLMFDYIMNDLKAKNPRIAVVYAETEFGKKGLEAAQKRAKQYGIKLVSELVLNIGSVDASSQVLSLKKDNVDYVVTCNLVPPIITFLKTAEKYDYWPTTFGINWSCDDMVVKACKTAAKNYIGVNCVGGWEDDTPGMKRVRELAKKNDRDPDKMLTSLYTHGVATRHSICRRAEACRPRPDSGFIQEGPGNPEGFRHWRDRSSCDLHLNQSRSQPSFTSLSCRPGQRRHDADNRLEEADGIEMNGRPT